MEHYIAYVANQIQLPDGLPIQLAPSATLRRATAEEIHQADSRLATAAKATSIQIGSYRHQYECNQTGPSSHFVPTLLPQEHWRYHVLDFKGDGLGFRRLQLTLVITEPPIYFAFTTVKSLTTPLDGVYPVQANVLERAEHLWWNDPNGQSVDPEQIRLTCQAHSELLHSRPKFMFAAEAVEKYFDLQRLPPSSDMYLLGLFSVIESLIAHKPRLTENLDSINHQLVNKLTLLDECFIDKPIQTTHFFSGIGHDKAWKKLYEFRSQLAHTSSSSLPHDLVSLQSKEVILRFINATTKELIRFAIAQPKLLRHLREW
jgi:hypothetical protein